jgi:Bacterial protein of unknown function (Gcw_chp)
MKGEYAYFLKFIYLFFFFTFTSQLKAQDLSLSANADLVSRYIWRGLNVNDQPNIQPSITFEYSNLGIGFWGSYGLTHQNSSDEYYSSSQEIDTWLNYSLGVGKSLNLTAIVTDYYYPNGGIKIGNFNNYNNPNGSGAHTVEAGLTIAGVENFPLSVSGFVNVYNDEGNNLYFQADYFTTIQEVGLGLFIGAAAGSKDNPGYYGTEKFSIINIGLKASKQIKISEEFSLPVSCSYILNPQAEISYLVFVISL